MNINENFRLFVAFIALVFCILPIWFPELKAITVALCLVTSGLYFLFEKKNSFSGGIWMLNASIWLLNILFLT